MGLGLAGNFNNYTKSNKIQAQQMLLNCKSQIPDIDNFRLAFQP
jgi:hypothetical protein